MARSALPDFGIEYPDYKFREWPKYVGLDAGGQALIADNPEHFEELKELAVYPKVLGKDRAGNDIIAHNPRDEEWFGKKVSNAVNSLTDEQPKRGPGRPPKFEAA